MSHASSRRILHLALGCVVACTGCYTLSETTFTPEKARTKYQAVVQSIETRGGRVIDFNDAGGRMNARCDGNTDTSCVSGVAWQGGAVTIPFDSLAKVTIVAEKFDYLTTTVSAFIAAAAIGSIYILIHAK